MASISNLVIEFVLESYSFCSKPYHSSIPCPAPPCQNDSNYENQGLVNRTGFLVQDFVMVNVIWILEVVAGARLFLLLFSGQA